MDSRKKAYVIGGFILLLLIVPYTRNVLIAQVAQAVDPDYGELGNRSVFKPSDPKVARDVSDALVLGYRRSSDAHSIDPYFQIVARFPNEPALCANLLKYATLFGPASIDSNARKMEQVIKTGQKLEPGNGYFDYFEGVLRFQQKRDAEGLAAVHRAAAKKHFNGHQDEETMALMRYSAQRWPFPLGWVNPINRISSAATILFPQFISFRRAAETVASYEEQSARQGNPGHSAEMMMDLVRIGAMMRDEGESTISALVGIAIQKLGVNAMYKGVANHPLDDGTHATATLPRLQTATPNALGEVEWRALSKNLARSEEFKARSKSYMAHLDSHWFMLGVMASIVWFSFGGRLLLNGLALGLVYLIVSATLHVRGGDGIKDVGPGKLSVALLAVLPIAIGLLVLSGLAIAEMFSSNYGDAARVFAVPVGTFMAVLIIFAIAAARTRVRPEVTRLNAFLARLKFGSAYAAKAFLVLYVIAMIINIPAAAWANHKVSTMCLHEVQTIWQYPAK